MIKDMVVELEDHSIVNLEIQKIGYKFPGERGACYSADLLLRQYKRVRSRRKNKFSYKDINDVYTIVLFEQSPKEFHDFPDTYLHYFEQTSDTGLELNLLQKYLFVSLDMFREIQHNKGINIEGRREAWLAFLSMDEPEAVIQVVEKYPDFRALYEQMYMVCRNIEEVMGMFSEELRELDRNTVQLMIDEMQEELNQARKELEKKEKELKQKEKEAKQKEKEEKQKEEEAEAKYQQALARIRELEAKQ